MKEDELWDSRAKIVRAEAPSGQSYFGRSYLKAIAIAFGYADTRRLCALKTDLWNEGVETNRDILGALERNRNLSLFGVDISKVVCYLAKRRLKNTNIIRADIRSMPFREGSFDIIFDLSTIDHVPPHQVPIVVREYRRALKKYALMLLVFWYESAFQKLIRILCKLREPMVSQCQYYLPVEQVKTLLLTEGFEMLGEYCTGTLLSEAGRTSGGLPKLIHALALRLEYSEFSGFLLKHFAGLFVIVARKSKKLSIETSIRSLK